MGEIHTKSISDTFQQALNAASLPKPSQRRGGFSYSEDASCIPGGLLSLVGIGLLALM